MLLHRRPGYHVDSVGAYLIVLLAFGVFAMQREFFAEVLTLVTPESWGEARFHNGSLRASMRQTIGAIPAFLFTVTSTLAYFGWNRRIHDDAPVASWDRPRPSAHPRPIPRELERQIQEGEDVVWSGKPSLLAYLISRSYGVAASGLPAALAGGAYFAFQAWVSGAAGMADLLSASPVFAVMTSAGALLTVVPFFCHALGWRGEHYVITDRRVLALSRGRMEFFPRFAFNREPLPEVVTSVFELATRSGTATLLFAPERKEVRALWNIPAPLETMSPLLDRQTAQELDRRRLRAVHALGQKPPDGEPALRQLMTEAISEETDPRLRRMLEVRGSALLEAMSGGTRWRGRRAALLALPLLLIPPGLLAWNAVAPSCSRSTGAALVVTGLGYLAYLAAAYLLQEGSAMRRDFMMVYFVYGLILLPFGLFPLALWLACALG